jgi:RTX calcium-binding nonapeptide repeat (4 copies)
MGRRIASIALVGLLLLVGVAMTATIVIPPSHAGQMSRQITANELKPPECAALDLQQIRIAGTSPSAGHGALLLGTSGDDRLIGGGSDDCVVGGAGDDDINPGGGIDICLGGAGVDTFRNCETQHP